MKIKVDVSRSRKVLEDFLSERYEVVDDGFDLLIVDLIKLKEKYREIERMKAKNRLLPVLLVTTRQEIVNAEKHLKVVDDIILEPLERIEFLKRVEVLLRLRRQSIERHAEMPELAKIFESIPHPVIVVNSSFDIIYVNRKAKDILKSKGIRKVVGEKCYRIFHGRDEPAENCPCVKALQDGEPKTVEVEMEVLGNTYFVSTTPIGHEDEISRIIHIAVDITEQKKARKRIEMLYRANRILNEVRRSILSAEDVGEILRTVAKKLPDLLPLKGIGVTLYEGERARVVFVEGSDIFNYVLRFKKLGEIIKILKAGRPWVVNEVRGEGEGERRLTDEGIKSYAFIPVVADDLLGSINLTSIEKGVFTDDVVNFLMEIASSVALAIKSHQTREKLRESEEIFVKMAEHSQVGIDIIRDGVFVYVNRKLAEILGYSPEELIGRDPVEFIHPEDRGTFTRYYRDRILGRKDHVNYRLRVVRRDGEVRILDTYGSRVEVGGKPAIVGISVDVTEEERLKEELKNYTKNLERMVEERTRQLAESEARYRSLVESPIVAFWEADANGTITFVNDRLLEMLGYGRDEVVGKMTMLDPVVPEQKEPLTERLRLYRERKLYADVVEAELVRKDGSRISVIASPSPIYDGEGNLSKIVGAMIDITDRKVAEEKLRHTLDELRKANEELEAYVNAISHDLKAPLRNIRGYINALIEDYGENADETMKFYLSRIEKLSEKMDSLVNDLLDYAKISKYSFTAGRISVNSIIEDVLEYLKEEIGTRDARIEVADIPAVRGDGKLLFSVMLNLLSNALKFVKKGVRPEIKIWSETANGKVRIFVRDNGIGIPGQYQRRIFNIFERLHGEEVYPGTGVGLAIVKKAMEIMGGEYGVKSKPGEGSTFWIELEVWADENGKNPSG
ncbi:GAF domain-containing sensor histidine kinase [Archaeoglobus neptunius]|uniref:GAF domain-containing sensor histidine kinase n=1 Tax=Archaeoglobus neptunius TaxID=2798580 RepID=UPI0019279A92|nr:PAS domain S-box protein [Archaeoglobus neptunius]